MKAVHYIQLVLAAAMAAAASVAANDPALAHYASAAAAMLAPVLAALGVVSGSATQQVSK